MLYITRNAVIFFNVLGVDSQIRCIPTCEEMENVFWTLRKSKGRGIFRTLLSWCLFSLGAHIPTQRRCNSGTADSVPVTEINFCFFPVSTSKRPIFRYFFLRQRCFNSLLLATVFEDVKIETTIVYFPIRLYIYLHWLDFMFTHIPQAVMTALAPIRSTNNINTGSSMTSFAN